MRRVCFGIIAFCCAGFSIPAQNTTSASLQSSGASLSAFNVTERGANYRVWERTENETLPSGKIVSRVHRFTELATGLHYWDAAANAWREARDEIVPVPGGAEATNGQHQIYFPFDIYSGVIEMVTPEGQHVQSRPLALGYSDQSNSVIIAWLQSAPGGLLGSNQVVYANAFSNAVNGASVQADIIYTYKKGSFEQDIRLRRQLPAPEDFGLDSTHARLEVLTEFFDPARPSVRAGTAANDDGTVEDDQISFGVMRLGAGRAFMSGTNALAAPVNKRWLEIDQRQILLEQVPLPRISADLAKLPLAETSAIKPRRRHVFASSKRSLPSPRRVFAREKRKIELASAEDKKPGFILDYITVNGSQGDYTFIADNTYYVSGPFTSSGVVTLQGGAIIKYGRNASISVADPGTVSCQSSPYHPFVCTAVDDNTVGEAIGTGSPSGTYATQAISYTGPYSPSSLSLSNFLIKLASAAVYASANNISVSLRNGQIVNCGNGLVMPGQGEVGVYNVLFSKFHAGFYGALANISAENVTFDGIAYDPPNNPAASLLISPMGNPRSISINSINCIVANVTFFSPDGTGVGGDHNGFYNCGMTHNATFGTTVSLTGNSPFQSAAGGNYYLLDSTFRGIGRADLDSQLLVDLGNRTTHPPVLHIGETFGVSTTFSPEAPKDAGPEIDEGYHYTVIDHLFENCTATAPLTFAAGVSAAWATPSTGQSPASALVVSGTTVTFNGTQAAPDCWANADALQEQGISTLAWLADGLVVTGPDSAHTGKASARFTTFSKLGIAGYGLHIRTDGYSSAALADCEVYGGAFGQGFAAATAFTSENCLFDGCAISQGSACPGGVTLYNCTMHFGQLVLIGSSSTLGQWTATARDTAFDSSVVSIIPAYVGGQPNWSQFAFDHDAFSGAHPSYPDPGTDQANVTFNWQAGPLGDFYLPSGSPLRSTGSRSPSDAGLLDFTTQTDGSREADKTPPGNIVDIAYHHVAVDENANAIDSNGDGIPDWWARQNGLDPNVTIQGSDDLHGPGGDPDGDGLSNVAEFALGSSPVRPDNTTAGATYKALSLDASLASKAYDVYYREDATHPWRRISSGILGQKTFTVVNPNPSSEGDYIFLDAADDDGDGLSNGYENWFTYNGQRTLSNFPYSMQSDLRKDGWKVTHGLNPVDNSGVNAPTYTVTVGQQEDQYDSQQKHDLYFAAAKSYDASYDPLKLTGTSDVRPVVTISDSHVTPSGDTASFTISRDVGSNGNFDSDLIVYYAFGGTLVYGRDFLVDPPPFTSSPRSDGYPRVFLVTISGAHNGNPGKASVKVNVSLTPHAPAGAAQSIQLTLMPYAPAQ